MNDRASNRLLNVDDVRKPATSGGTPAPRIKMEGVGASLVSRGPNEDAVVAGDVGILLVDPDATQETPAMDPLAIAGRRYIVELHAASSDEAVPAKLET